MAESRRKQEQNVTDFESTVGQRSKAGSKVDRTDETTRAPETGQRHVFGSFLDRESAERAYGFATKMGYDRDDFNILMSNETQERYFPEDVHFRSKVTEGASAGAAIGGTAVGLLGALVAIGTTIALPGIGVLLAGPLVAGLAGAGAGGIAGGLIGALVGWGIPENDARQYEKDIRDGRIVMSIAPRSDDDATDLQEEWERLRLRGGFRSQG
jgi:hypothetical protein